MNFDLSDDQVALRDGIRSLAEGRFDSARVRRGFDRSVFDELSDAGVFSLLADGFGWADAAIVFEELGRAAVPGPLVWSFLALGLTDGGVDGVVDGGGIVGGVDAGPPILVEHFDVIDTLIVLTSESVRHVARAELVLEEIEWPLDPLTPVARVATLPAGEAIAHNVHDWRCGGAVLTSAFLVGLAQRATELAVEHATSREQFGRAIGSFQAVKHLCADMAVRTELARVATHAAAVHLDDPGLGATDRAVAGAKVLAGEAAIRNGLSSTQVHGGMGFTWEVDVHLLLKRAWVLDTHFGSVDAHALTLGGG